MKFSHKIILFVSFVSFIGIGSAYFPNVDNSEVQIKPTFGYNYEAQEAEATAKHDSLIEKLGEYGILSVNVDNADRINGNADNVVIMEVSEDIKLFNTYGNAIECDVTADTKYVKDCILSGKSFADKVKSGEFEGWGLFPKEKSDHEVICYMNKVQGNNLHKALPSGVNNCIYVSEKETGSMNLAEKLKVGIKTPITEKYLNAAIEKLNG